MMESPPSPAALAPMLLRNILLPLFIFTEKSLSHLIHKFKLFELIRYSFLNVILSSVKIFPSLIPFSFDFNLDRNSRGNSTKEDFDYGYGYDFGGCFRSPLLNPAGKSNDGNGIRAGDSCIGRALTQLLAIINEIPVSSRKYETVRSYAERLMDENLEEGHEPLRKVNATVLSAAFSRALRQLESAVAESPAEAGDDVEVEGAKPGSKLGGYFGLNRVIKTVEYIGDAAWTRFASRRGQSARGLRGSAEKLSAELLWLAQKLAECGGAEEAVCQWASASKLAWVALSAQPRLQGSLVKLSAFLFKQARDMGGEESDMEEVRKAKMKMLMSWLPFLCRASVGTDAPVLSLTEKADLERVLGEVIEALKHEEEQEKVLSLWLHHFTHCPSSDWPNLHPYYAQWCEASRKLLILEGK